MAKNEFAARRLEYDAKELAQWIIDRYAIDCPEHIQLEQIAKDLNVEVIDAPIDGAVARLIRSGKHGVIRVDTASNNAGRRRFSIAHELGHFMLEHSTSGFLGCAEEWLTEFRETEAASLEAQANVFAVNLLLPEMLVRRRCEISPVDFRPVKELASDFQTSLTAAAIRFVEFSSEVCALVFSRGGRIVWSRKSSDFRCPIRGWGQELSEYSIAVDYFTKGRTHDRPEQVDASAWLEGWMARRASEVVEHSMVIPSIEAVLTLIWVPSDQLE